MSNPAEDAAALADTFKKNGALFLFIGQSGSIILGYPGTTQDVDIFAAPGSENAESIIASLRQIGFAVTAALEKDIRRNKDFIQIRNNGPFDLDIIFALDGIESFEKAAENAVVVAGLPVMHPDDIIRSKEAARRQKDVETLPRLKQFSQWIQRQWQRSGGVLSYRNSTLRKPTRGR